VTELDSRFRSEWRLKLRDWQARIDAAGLGELARGLEQGLRPLAPLAAQLLWVSQPGFALFGQYEAIGGLADLLDDLPAHSSLDDG
jgi:hypothetical protein